MGTRIYKLKGTLSEKGLKMYEEFLGEYEEKPASYSKQRSRLLKTDFENPHNGYYSNWFMPYTKEIYFIDGNKPQAEAKLKQSLFERFKLHFAVMNEALENTPELKQSL